MYKKILITTATLLFVGTLQAAMLFGKAVHVADCDTITVLDSKYEKHRVRLMNIDCPEKKQPWGKKAKRALADKVGNKIVRIDWSKKDHYGRIIGTVMLDGFNINRAMVQEGHCWVYRRYNKDPALLTLEAIAKRLGSGLWSLSQAQRIPPWEWRHNNKDRKF